MTPHKVSHGFKKQKLLSHLHSNTKKTGNKIDIYPFKVKTAEKVIYWLSRKG